MKGILLLSLFCGFVINDLKSQVLKTSLGISPTYIWISSNSDKVTFDKSNFGFSVLIKEEYYFRKLLSIGSEIIYTNQGAIFRTPFDQNHIPEIIYYYKNTVTLNSLEIPLIIKLRDKKESNNMYCFWGVGLSYFFSNNKKVESVNYYMGNPDKANISLIGQSDFNFWNGKSSIGNFMILGVGKNLKIKKVNFFTEIRYRQNLNYWYYPTLNDPVDSEFKIRTNNLSLCLGIVL